MCFRVLDIFSVFEMRFIALDRQIIFLIVLKYDVCHYFQDFL